MLGDLRISSKLRVMVGLSVLGILVVAGVGLSTLRDNLLKDRKIKLHDVVLLARQAIDLDYQSARKAGLSDAEVLERGRALLRTLKFGNDDYFYALNQQGELQSHPNPKIEGRNMYEVADSDGVFFSRRQIELAAKGGGFVSFRFPPSAATFPCRRSPMRPNSSHTTGPSAAASISTTSM